MTTARKKPAKPAADLPPGRDPNLDVESVIADMPDNFIQCRDFNHSWRSHNANYDAGSQSYDVTLKCTRCKAERIRTIDSHGGLVSSHYDYKDGYLIKGMGRLTGNDRNALRLNSVLRVLGKQ